MQSHPAPAVAKERVRRFDPVGMLLSAAMVLVLAGGMLAMRTLADRHSRAQADAQEWIEATRRVAQLWVSVAELYAAGVEPPEFAAPSPMARRDERLNRARERFQQVTEQVETGFSGLPSNDDVATLADEMSAVTDPVHEMIGRIDGLPRPGAGPPDRRWILQQIQGIDERYELGRAAHERLSAHADAVLRNLLAARDEASAAMVRTLYIGSAALFLLMCGLLLHSHARSQRERGMRAEKEVLLGQMRDAEVRYRSIFNNAVEGIFQTEPDGCFITANRALARMYGYDSPEQLMERMKDISVQLYVEPSQRGALLEALKTSDVVSNYEFEVVRADGRTMWVRENVRAVRNAEGELLSLEGTVEDVSDLWWGEQRRRLQYAITRVMADAATVVEAKPELLRTICEALDWDVGIVWKTNEAKPALYCVEFWQAPGLDVKVFEESVRPAEIRRGEGLTGEVWVSGEPRWIADLNATKGYASAPLALACGLSSAFAVPVQVDGAVVHVFEFFCKKITPPDSELIQTLGVIAGQLGHLIERKRAEEALRKSEMRKAAILQSALDCIMTFDLDGRITEFNPASERTFGVRQEDVLGRDVAELFFPDLPPDGVQPGAALYDRVRSGTGTRRRELVATRADGSAFPVEISVSNSLVGDRTMFTAYVRDVSERKEAERLTSELALVVANSNDAIIACTIDGIVRSWNLGAERIFGYGADEMIGRALHALIPPDHLDEFPQTLTAIRRGDSLANYETVRLRKDGRKISVSLTDSPIRGEGGAITGLSSIARDITERKRLEEELLQSQKMDAVGRLAGGIAHDFNNILTAILGYSDLIIGQTDERQWMYKHLVEIRKAADFAASLTHQLLAFSRRQPLFLRVVNINDSVRNMEKMLRRVIGEHIRIVARLDAEVGRLKADPSQLEQVLLNLCVNARDAMPHGGTITIATADVTYCLDDSISPNEMPAGEYVKLTVSDTGSGMTPEVKKHIFEPFFTTKEKGQGTGLGLATCYGIIKQTGGYISVDSTVGAGSTFSVYLPWVDETGEKSAVRKEVGQLTGGNETILYVEDEITVRSLTAHVLRRLGYTVLEAADGKQARDLVEGHGGGEIDLLFSDVVLPDAGGRDLADWMRARSTGTRILFTSGYVDEGTLQRHGLDSETAFLQKPFTPADLAKKVREVVDGDPDGNS